MSQENIDKADAAESRTQQTRGFIQRVRVASRRKYTPKEKVRIVLEGFRQEVAVNELCRREGIKVCTEMRFRPELALSRLQTAELLLEHYPNEKKEASDHLDFVITEFRDMKMNTYLERAFRFF